MHGAGGPAIDERRLKRVLDGINGFGRLGEGAGYDRRAFGDADMAVRRWLADTMRTEGLAVTIDGAANVAGRLGPSDRPCIIAGSHLDTVPSGGAFDGALGVAVALECAMALRDAGTPLAHPLEVVATSDEEGRFGGMLGSQALTGQVSAAWLARAADADGVALTGAMAAQGLDASDVLGARRPRGSVRAFLELHVEQGPVLEKAGASIGIATEVSGVTVLSVGLNGVANHSGTTPMELRADAFAGLAEIAAAIPTTIAAHGTAQSRVTIGKVELSPNVPHTIPGAAHFTAVLRDTDAAAMHRLCAAFRDEIAAACNRHGLDSDVAESSRLPPVGLDDGIAGLLAEEARRLGLTAITMPSGAGHDAQTMQAFCPAGLVFVPSAGGISHAPREWTDWSDIIDGARLMLATLARLVAGDESAAARATR